MQRITFRTPFYLHFQIGCLDAYALFLLFFPQTLTDVSPKSFMESFAGLKKNHWENTVMRANVGLKKDGRCHHLWFCDREGSGIKGDKEFSLLQPGRGFAKTTGNQLPLAAATQAVWRLEKRRQTCKWQLGLCRAWRSRDPWEAPSCLAPMWVLDSEWLLREGFAIGDFCLGTFLNFLGLNSKEVVTQTCRKQLLIGAFSFMML